MPYRLTKIYTRQGDKGFTNLRKKSLSKDHPLVEALGAIDELNSSIGLITAFNLKDTAILDCLTAVQQALLHMGGELYAPEHPLITQELVTDLEQKLDAWNKTLPALKEFILPRGNPAAACTHLARTICRRAERTLVHLHRQEALRNPEILRYLNRLSDLLFVIARILAREAGKPEQLWEH